MKTLWRSLALTAVLGFASLPPANGASIGACRYICSNPFQIVETYASNCCSRTFTCPNGQTTTPYAVYTAQGWRICGPAV